MSNIKMFRVNAYDPVTHGVEVYCKIEDADGYILGNLCIADDGIYYYRAKSRILTRNENANARFTANGFISMENLKALFEALIKAGLSTEEITFTARKKGNTVTIEKHYSD
jgi:hypothetical protein